MLQRVFSVFLLVFITSCASEPKKCENKSDDCSDEEVTIVADDDDDDDDDNHSAALGTWENPILISSFPYSDERNTSEAPSALYDRYSCALETDEGGDGFVYLFNVPQAGKIEAQLDDIPNDDVDVDLHILSHQSADACLIRDNISLSYNLEPGNYYLVTDTWVSDAGDILAGPYHLEANFIPDTNEEIPYGAPENPIEVIAFPFNDTRDTQVPAADAWDSYSCAPDTNESGGEFVYKLSLPSGGDLAVELTESPDVDVDIHLLSNLDPDDCLERHNTELSTHLEAGTYYLAVDTWSDGTEIFPGTYDLSIAFTPDAPSPEGEGTLSSPILVNQFPFVDQRNTQSSESDVFDAYTCDPDIDESGNEFIYKIEVPQAGIIQAHLNDISNANVDIDIHLLSDTNAESCLIRGHQDIVFALEAGTYYLVADTWTNTSGEALAGQYELEILFSQAPDLSDFCLVVYGDTRGNSSNDLQPAHRAVTQAMNEQCENTTFVHTGDLVRSGSSTSDWDTFVEIESAIYDSEGILYPVRGNHDGSWSNMMTRLSPLLTETIETSHYTRTLSEHLTLIGLDSQRSAEDQASWLEEQLSDPDRASHRFVIAFHRPLYPSAGGHAGWSDGKTHWMPIFQQYAGRIVVVSGHNHAMAREKVEGVDFVTSGGGGAPLYSCSLRHEDTKFCANKYGYYVCDAELDCVGYEIDVETGAKIMIDAFEIRGDAN